MKSGMLVTGNFTRILGFHFSPTTSEHLLRASTESQLVMDFIVQQTGKSLYLTTAVRCHPLLTEDDWWLAGHSRLPLITWPFRQSHQCLTPFGYPDWGFRAVTQLQGKCLGADKEVQREVFRNHKRPSVKAKPHVSSLHLIQFQPFRFQPPDIHPNRVLTNGRLSVRSLPHISSNSP